MVGVELGYRLVWTYVSREGDMSWGHGPGKGSVDVHLQRRGYVMGTIGTGTDRSSIIPRNRHIPRVQLDWFSYLRFSQIGSVISGYSWRSHKSNGCSGHSEGKKPSQSRKKPKDLSAREFEDFKNGVVCGVVVCMMCESVTEQDRDNREGVNLEE